MTVKELMEKLAEFPLEATVLTMRLGKWGLEYHTPCIGNSTKKVKNKLPVVTIQED